MDRDGISKSGVTILMVFALLLPASLAEARIAPQKGIMGINLNMSRARVIQEKGQPDAERVVPNEILGQQRIMRYGKTRVGFSGASRNSRVITVTTRDRRQRTRSGVGVGSTEAAVQSGVQGIRCRTEFGSRHCFKGSFEPGQRVTDFSISQPGRRVTRVTVGFVID